MLALLSSYWWVLVIRGVIAIALGIFAFVWPLQTITALVLVFDAPFDEKIAHPLGPSCRQAQVVSV